MISGCDTVAAPLIDEDVPVLITAPGVTPAISLLM